MNRYSFFTLILSLLFIGTIYLHAQIPRTLSYQGVLTDSTGNPKPDGSYNLVFRMYDMASGGTALWSESETVSTKRGLFSSILGDGSAFPITMKFDKQYWLSIQVDAPPELSPRIPLTAVGYSMHSLSADTAYVTVTSIGDTLWKKSGSNIYRLTGNVGIGTTNPIYPLTVDASNYGIVQQGEDGIKVGSFIGGGRGWYGTFSNHPFSLFVNDGYDALTISTSNNVGIGTTNPTSLLHLVKNQNLETTVYLDNNDAGPNARSFFSAGEDISKRVSFGYINSGFSPIVGQELVTANSAVFGSETQVINGIRIIAASVNAPIIFGTGGRAATNERMRITSTGNVGIGTTTPAYKLDVNGDMNIAAGSVYRIGGVEQTGSSKWTAGTGDNIYRLNGFVGIGTSNPSATLDVKGSILARNKDGGIVPGTFSAINNVGNIYFATRTQGDAGIIYINDATGLNRIHLFANGNTYFNGGNVGIGTTSPTGNLHIQSAGNTVLKLQSTSISTSEIPRFQFYSDLSSSDIRVGSIEGFSGTTSKGGLEIYKDGGIGLYGESLNGILINNTGNVGIGTTTPSSLLTVKGDGTSLPILIMQHTSNSSNGVQFGNTNATSNNAEVWNFENGFLRFGTNNTDRIRIAASGNVGIGTINPTETLEVKVGGTTLADAWSIRSSRRWKTNIKPLEGSLDKVEKLQGVSFSWIADGKNDIGLIAEDVGEIVPEVVTFEDNGIDAKSIDYAKLVALLIEAMKDQQKQIDELKATLNSLSPKPIE